MHARESSEKNRNAHEKRNPREALSPEQISHYRDQGYLLVKGMFRREEASRFRKAAHELIERLSRTGVEDATWGSARKAAGESLATRIFHCHNVQFHSAELGGILYDGRLAGAAADLMGTANVALHHNKLFIKPPEAGSPFPMHQDAPYFPHERHTMLAAIVHFDDAPYEKGCVRVVPGSHKLGLLRHFEEGGWHLPPEKYPIEEALPCPAEAGDVLFFHYHTIHGSGINRSSEARTTCLFQLRDPEDMPTTGTHQSRGQGMILRGIDPTARYGSR